MKLIRFHYNLSLKDVKLFSEGKLELPFQAEIDYLCLKSALNHSNIYAFTDDMKKK